VPVLLDGFISTVVALPLLDMALAVCHSGHGFDKNGIEPYTPQH